MSRRIYSAPRGDSRHRGTDPASPSYSVVFTRMCSQLHRSADVIQMRQSRMFRTFLYLQQGKLFHLTPPPEVAAIEEGYLPLLYERFRLCDRCCKKMIVVWGRNRGNAHPLPGGVVARTSASPTNGESKLESKTHVVIVGQYPSGRGCR